MSELPEIEPHLLWHWSYYDGPLSGVCQWDGWFYWFEVVDALDNPPEYLLYRLTAREFARECAEHFEFERLVGTYSCHHPATPDECPPPESSWREFFERYPEEENPRVYPVGRSAVFRVSRWAPR